MTLQWYRWPDGTRLRHEYNGVVVPAHRVVDGSTGDRGMIDEYRDVDWSQREIERLTAERDQLRDTLKELTTAVETECRHDTVLRKALSPYCDAARVVLQEAKDD